MSGKKIWVKDPSLNIRDVGGVQFRGKYVTAKEYLQMRMRKRLLALHKKEQEQNTGESG